MLVDLPAVDGLGHYVVFAHHETLTHAKNLDPQSNATETIFGNGCYLVDHFDAVGAKLVTGFWDQYILLDGTKELLSEVGNSGTSTALLAQTYHK